ncbi:nitrite/sulfite reductase [Bifidobacterium sp. SMB2]|uniref:assimilatory sulfite reductase (ferredoxin) n=1 Tax=Bifidobacterium saimiriisciurei TaxID=2661627 RepID=A0ABX0CC51_9BIFI|nr:MULTISPECIES: nitrite/sulfite reductase [Bifidobacterium]NEG96975.1 nitrite/sulfite reductase [Bifidobacterium sp. SMB2]NEH12042.1 nitrite/sulfite reductase [Bifidobacterium saimiriisciurei]
MSYIATWADQKLNANEISKLKEDGLDVFKDLPELVKKPFSEVDKSYFMYFKYAGLTVQKPQDEGYFMMRIKIPGGRINIKQADHIAWIGEHYAHGVIDLTTRQAVQYHWIPFAELVDIFAGIENVGLTTVGAEGDITRNVIDNTLSGIDPDELFDTRQTVLDVYRRFQGNYDYSNLPRKFKISISSNLYNAADAEINDLAFVPATKRIGRHTVKGFNVKVGGGLGMKPYLAQQLNIFVTPDRVADVAEVVCRIYRDYGYRRSRSKARLKFLVKDWGAEKFEDKVREYMPDLQTKGRDRTKGWNNGNALGIHRQKQKDFYYIGVSVPSGRISADDFKALVDVAREYGKDEIRFDHCQNMIIPWIPADKIKEVEALPIFEKFSLHPHLIADYGNTCTGAEYCNLANTLTKSIFKPLVEELDNRFSFDSPLNVTMTGCGNNCAHRSIADIGVEGVHARTPDRQHVPGFKLSVGGSLVNGGHFNEQLKGTFSQAQLADSISSLLADYRDNHEGSETFYEYYSRTGTDHFQEVLNNYTATLPATEVLK